MTCIEGRLLAKSCDSDRSHDSLPDSVFLPGHLRDVHAAAEQVLAHTGEEQLRALGLDLLDNLPRFSRIVLLAAAVHDLGKANDHFQGMLQPEPYRHRDGLTQGLRHEWVTLLMLESLQPWLLPALGDEPLDWQIMLWAVAGHHPAYHRPSPPQSMEGTGREIELLMGCDDFQRCLAWISRAFSLPDPPATSSYHLALVGTDNLFARHIMPWFVQSRKVWRQLRRVDRRIVGAVKACLIAGDVAGSALPRKFAAETQRRSWITQAFANGPAPGRIQRIVDRKRGSNPLYAFQESVATSASPVTFVRAGCGSGKTLAAYQWAARQHPGRRLYFCYPTTGTATEGFRDYLHAPEEEFDAELFHGRAAVDLEMMLGDTEDDHDEGITRIDSLDAWSTPIVACTVDTVLGLLQNNRRGLYAWPALAGAAFVFDEIHAYDDRLFGVLLRFLEDVPGVPTLLMTASLQAARLQAIQAIVDERAVELPVIPSEPLVSERWPRYRRQGPGDARDSLDEVRAELARGGKVLWVCNTVDRAIAAANAAEDLNPSIYHSRFRYMDRIKRHKQVIDAFGHSGPALAVCTQVAEMSLDLSATLLVTELAPIPALIQRLGRLNRRAKQGDLARPFIVTEVGDSHLPYSSDELEAARGWLQQLGDDPVSQLELAKRWEEFDADRDADIAPSAWLDGGPVTQVRELREPSYGITVLLQQDAPDVRSGQVRPVQVALPMPPPRKPWDRWRSWPRVRGVPVAPSGAIDYDAQRGAQWRR